MSLIIPNTFATKDGSIQLSLLDENFTYVTDSVNTVITDVANLSLTTTTSISNSISNLSLSTISGTVPVSKGGTGLTTSGTSGSMLISNGTIWTTAIITAAVSYFASSTAPTGWLKANGAAISRTVYATLFAAIGTTYGVGDGSTTFNIPDLRGEFVRGWDDGRGIDVGRVFGTYQAPTTLANLNDQSEVNVFTNVDESTARANIVGGGGQASSSRSAVQNSFRPRNVALLACIKF